MLDQRSSRLQASSLFLLSLFLMSDLLTGKYHIFEWLGVPRPPVFRCNSTAPDSPAPTRTTHEAILTANGLLDLNLKVVSINSADAKEPKADADLPKLVFAVLTLGAAMALIGYLATSLFHLPLPRTLNSRWITDQDFFGRINNYVYRTSHAESPREVRIRWAQLAILHHDQMSESLRSVILRRWDVVVLSWNFMWLMLLFGIIDYTWAYCVLNRSLACPIDRSLFWLWICWVLYIAAFAMLAAQFYYTWQDIVSITDEFLKLPKEREDNSVVRIVIRR